MQDSSSVSTHRVTPPEDSSDSAQSSIIAWVCPRCRKALQQVNDIYRCSECGSDFGRTAGLIDFRLNYTDNDNQLALAEDFVKRWSELTYADMIHARWENLRKRVRETAADRGEAPIYPKRWERDERAHLATYRVRGELHCQMLSGMVRDAGGEPRVKLLLDVGCGWGRDLLQLASLGEHVVGVDVSAYSLLMTKKLLEENNISNVDLILAEGEHLPLASGSVDGINSSATIEHFPDAGAFLTDASRCLSTAGWLFLYYPNRFSLLHETHTDIFGLGWVSDERQRKIVARKLGYEWTVKLFSRRSFLDLLRKTFPHRVCRITGLPPGLEEFAQTSKFSRRLGPLLRPAKMAITLGRGLAPCNWLLSFFAPVHYIAAIRDG